MSALPNNCVLLADLLPRAGFRWRRGQSSRRILRSESRDATVRRAIGDLLGGDGRRIRKPEAQKLVVKSLATAAKTINHEESGIRPGEGIIDFLERSAKPAELSQAIPKDVWVELVYQIAHAHTQYKRHTPQAQQDNEHNRLTVLSFAIDDLIRTAGSHWDWLALEFYAYPHLMGESVDYKIDEDEE